MKEEAGYKMINWWGSSLWALGIIFIIVSFYFLNLIMLKYFKKDRRIYFYISLFFIFLFMLLRIYIVIYSDKLINSGLSSQVVTEKILFLRMFLNLPFVIAVTILLSILYLYFLEFKNFK